MIRLERLTKAFRQRRVLGEVSLDIARGDRIALVGSNGAGKTTLIRCLLGEYTYDGIVEVDGLSPRMHRQDVLAKIGFVPQLPPPLKMPVGELINFAASMCNSVPERMEAVSARLGLEVEGIRRQPFVKLSGGQKQKLLIGIALGRDCNILVMDEPAANLDPEARQVFFGLLGERQKDVTMLLSSHRLDEVAALVNRVIELDRGAVVLDDHVADTVDMRSILSCTVRLTRREEAFEKALGEWGFSTTAEGGGLEWGGQVAGPDRLRFLGVLSRYAGLLAGINLEDNSKKAEAAQ
ncbi:MAG: ABC transporter ATP-binding protein [Rhodospirillales bacterium]|nr:ABC transporter ATP-binding protein [Rhodospirillales bacterium]MCW8860993.1 ABC transporter ATP-binding protein [Rhodospirillales bacterium]